MVIRENEIFKRLETIVQMALSQLGISGFQVMQVSQPIATSDHACVLISRVDVHRYGWQGLTYEKPDVFHPEHWKRTKDGIEFTLSEPEKLTVKESWHYIDEATFQISAFLPRKTSDGVVTVTSYDAVSAIATWLMSPIGIKTMNDQGLQPLRISDVRTPIQQDDSNIPQFNPNFDLRFCVSQTSGMKIPAVTKVTVERHSV